MEKMGKVILSMVVGESTLLVTLDFKRQAGLAATSIVGQQSQFASVFQTTFVVQKEQFHGKINIFTGHRITNINFELITEKINKLSCNNYIIMT